MGSEGLTVEVLDWIGERWTRLGFTSEAKPRVSNGPVEAGEIGGFAVGGKVGRKVLSGDGDGSLSRATVLTCGARDQKRVAR